jgi:hypothetical protein
MERILAETPPRNAIKFSQMSLPYFSCGVSPQKKSEREREKERKKERKREREREFAKLWNLSPQH